MSEQSDKEWSRTTLERVASQIAALRKARGWSAQDLANRINDLGYDLPRGAIAKIESGRRSVDVPEFLVLAKALEIPPFALIADLPTGDRVWGFPNERDVHPWNLVSWWRGDAEQFDRANLSSMPARAHIYTLDRWLQFESLWLEAAAADTAWRTAKSELDVERSRGTVPVWVEQLAEHVRARRVHLDRLIADLSKEWRTELTASGRTGAFAMLGADQPSGGADGDD